MINLAIKNSLHRLKHFSIVQKCKLRVIKRTKNEKREKKEKRVDLKKGRLWKKKFILILLINLFTRLWILIINRWFRIEFWLLITINLARDRLKALTKVSKKGQKKYMCFKRLITSERALLRFNIFILMIN